MRRVAAALALAGCASAPAPSPAEPTPEEDPEVAVALRLTEAPANPEGVPTTEAALVLIFDEGRRQFRSLGRLAGVCTHEPGEGALLQVRCWWAGAGTLLRLVRDGDTLLVTRVELDEMTGAGPPRTLDRVALPPHASLRPIGP